MSPFFYRFFNMRASLIRIWSIIERSSTGKKETVVVEYPGKVIIVRNDGNNKIINFIIRIIRINRRARIPLI